MNLAKKIARNTLIQVIGKVASTILGLFSLALITRYLGQDGFGKYTTIATFLTFFATIADLGLTLITVQMISGRKGKEENRLLKNLFGLRLFSALLFIGLAPIIVLFFPYGTDIKYGVLIFSASFVFPALNQVLIGLFQKNLSMERDTWAEIIGRVFLLAGLVIVQKSASGLNGVLTVSVAASAVNFLFHLLWARKFSPLGISFDFKLWREIIGRSWPLAVTIVLNLIYLRADTLILSLYEPAGTVGLYGAAYKIIDVLTTLPFMFAGLILPILTAAWNDGKKDFFKKVLQKSFDVMALAAIPLIVGTQILGKPIMILVAGQDFGGSGPILNVLIFAVGAIFLGTMFSHAVIALNRQKKMIGFYVFVSLSSLTAYLLLIPKFSVFGAAGVTVYSETFIALASAYCVYRYSHFRPNLKALSKAVLASLLMWLALAYLPASWSTTISGLSAEVALAVVVYSLAAFLLRAVSSEDLKALLKRQKKAESEAVTIYGRTEDF